MTKRAIFFDRDGVINALVPRPDGRNTTPWSVDEFVLLPQVYDAIKLVAPHFQCFVVTNQPHVGHEMTVEDLETIHTHLRTTIPFITDIAFCSEQGSYYYKPNPGMVRNLIVQHQLSVCPWHHYMIGDRWKDIVCGYKVGVNTIFVGDKYDDGGTQVSPNYYAKNIYDACQQIMEHMK